VTPVTPYLSRYATALLLGAAAATLAVNLAPGVYYDLVEYPLAMGALPEALRLFAPGLTPGTAISSFFMGFFFLLLGKELWEAIILERGGLHGRRALVPLALVLGGAVGAVLTWALLAGIFETATEAADTPGWAFPLGGSIVISVLFGRKIFGPSHPALQFLLYLTVIEAILGLVVAGLAAPVGLNLRPLWLLLPLGAALTGYHGITRPLVDPAMTERSRRRARHLWPWLVLGLIAWIGVSASGLPPALGFLPILPAMPHGTRSFGLFSEAEGLLTDPLNRLEQWLMPAVVVVMLSFGLTGGAVDLGALGPTTLVTLAAFSIGKPLGILLVAGVLRLSGSVLPRGLTWRHIVLTAGLMGIGFATPLLTMQTTLPGGAMQEAARLGLAFSIVLGPLVGSVARVWKA
tara:strand:- start:420 stop:1634 length:1215 start_codon:yes stop_codon:yes gene_type:complete